MKKKYDGIKMVFKCFTNEDVLTASGDSLVSDDVWNENPWGKVGGYFMGVIS